MTLMEEQSHHGHGNYIKETQGYTQAVQCQAKVPITLLENTH